MHTVQSCFSHLSVSIGEVLVTKFLSGTPPCSTIFRLTKPLLCSLISSAICFHDDASVLFGVGGQKIGNTFSGFSSFFMYQVSFFLSLSLSFCLSFLFQFLLRCKGLFQIGPFATFFFNALTPT